MSLQKSHRWQPHSYIYKLKLESHRKIEYVGPGSCSQDSYKADEVKAIAANGKGKEFARTRILNT